MASKLQTHFDKNVAGKSITVTRNFDAPIEDVWRAWTESELLDQWWAPKPWRAETKEMNFREGGFWLYAMVGPQQERHYAKMNFNRIEPMKRVDASDIFCDENGNENTELPGMDWTSEFTQTGSETLVKVTLNFATEEDLDKMLAMGFEEGFSSALGNLDQYLASRFQLRSELQSRSPRVTTYLNFPGNTEEAFNFYKSVFGSEFSGKGLQRFRDISPSSGHGPVADEIKDLILHVELPILGGHVLMATDAPPEMGFTLSSGNNMHICLEPVTRAETERLFNRLSDGGKITMPLADMFFGAYFGECSDKYGINWMFNCFEKANEN